MAVEWFSSYEERQRHLTTAAGLCLASPTEGLGSVLKTTTEWLLSDRQPARGAVTLPADPSLALIFPTLEGDLNAVLANRQAAKVHQEALAALERVGLRSSVLVQASRTLSGGEKCLAMLAKAFSASDGATSLLACNPAQWLAAEKRPIVADLIREYEGRELPWSLLCLDGEPTACEPNPSLNSPAWTTAVSDLPTLDFSIVMHRPGVELGDPSGLTDTPPMTFSFRSAGDELTLKSPAVWSGPNGLGKSVFGALLSGSIALARGAFEVKCAGFRGGARLIRQDPIPQLFGRSPLQYLNWSFREAQAHKLGRALELYEHIESDITVALMRNGSRTIIGTRPPASYLQARIALVAARLTSGTPLLVLDEPGFGLTRDGTRAFVESVASASHRARTSLMILTHTPEWFTEVTRSTINCARLDTWAHGAQHAAVELGRQ